MARRSDHSREQLNALILTEARRIICEEGIGGLSARKIARGIGYTVGTIYQRFSDMDGLVQAVNAGTLQALKDRCDALPVRTAPGDRLADLATAFLDFAEEHPAEWDAVITYQYGPRHEWTEDYDKRVEALLALIADATDELYSGETRPLKERDVRLLWAGLYGIFSLKSRNRLGKGVSVDELIRSLIDLFVQARRRTPAPPRT